jgi:hypothetical protein
MGQQLEAFSLGFILRGFVAASRNRELAEPGVRKLEVSSSERGGGGGIERG